MSAVRCALCFVTALVIVNGTRASSAQAQVNMQWGGRVQTDVRGRLERMTAGDWVQAGELDKGVVFNRNLYKLRLNAEAGQVVGVVNLDFLWLGLTDRVHVLEDLTLRERIDPYRLKAHALYVEIRDVFVPGLDVRFGQQVVNWGKGDQFNPTNNLNSADLEDPLLFGEQLANTMLRADYAPTSSWTLSAVVVPVFKPALLPDTASLALLDTRHIPIIEDKLRRRLYTESAIARDIAGYATILSAADITLPQASFDNMQYALRLAGTLLNQDVALSYYIGRYDFPQPYTNQASQVPAFRCDPADPSQCIEGTISTQSELRYPRMEVLGLNIAGEVQAFSWLSEDAPGLGYHLEAGLYMPHRADLRLYSGPINLGVGPVQPAGEYDYGLGGARPTVVEDRPFAKWNLGVDYTFGAHVYVNAQWVHGFIDEYGAGDFVSSGYTSLRGFPTASDLTGCYLQSGGDECVGEYQRRRIGDYLVIGADTKFLDDTLLLRLFVIYDVTGVYLEEWDPALSKRVRTYYSPFSKNGASAILFPELTYNAGGGLELSVGGLVALGKDYTKFGAPATGGSLVWTRGRYNF